jgi:hypothetical protein
MQIDPITRVRLAPLAFALCLLSAPAMLRAQATPSDPATSGAMYDELAGMDSTLFDAAFVSCDAAKTNAMFTEDVEFYHDVTGMSAGQQVRDQFVRLTQNCPRANGISRVLERGSLRVYPMNHYGAVQTGTHRFVNRSGQAESVAMFVHLWRRVDGEWKLARVLSYDHRPDTSAGAARED